MIHKQDVKVSVSPGTLPDEVVVTAALHLEFKGVCQAGNLESIARESERLRSNVMCSVTGGIAERLGSIVQEIRRIQCLFENDKYQSQAIDSLVKLCSELRGS